MSHSTADGRRRLLLIYIHGFMGNETSFQRFPAHVQRSLSQPLSATHTVDCIVYPRFKTRKKINVAGDDFSHWLQQHESDSTDIVLLGHSMGGLLAADIALLTSGFLGGHGRGSRHRILGVVGLDTPLLGMHPSVVVSGLGSLFKGKPERSDPAGSGHPEQDSTTLKESQSEHDFSELSLLHSLTPEISTSSTPTISSASGTNVHPPSNVSTDDFLTVPEVLASKPKPSTWSRALYFIDKHSDNVTKASKAYLTSHLEFGGCMADYQGLINRYNAIRALEDRDHERVRFVNYYTASTGRPKRKKEKGIQSTAPLTNGEVASRSGEDTESRVEVVQGLELSSSVSNSSTRLSSEVETETEVLSTTTSASMAFNDNPTKPAPNTAIAISPSSSTKNPFSPPQASGSNSSSTPDSTTQTNLTTLSPSPVDENLHPPELSRSLSPQVSSESADSSSLPSIPPRPSSPTPFNSSPSLYPSPSALKAASRAYAADLKAHRRAIKERDKAIIDRRKELGKRAKAASKSSQKEKEEPLNDKPPPKDELQSATSDPPPPPTAEDASAPSPGAAEENPGEVKKPKHRHFCLLPRKNAHGERDVCWIRVVMKDVDEVGAHCGLFAASGGHYEWFVQDVVERVGEWVGEDGRMGV